MSLSDKINLLDDLIYCNEGAKKLGTKGITGQVIFLDDVKEFIKELKERICGEPDLYDAASNINSGIINELAGDKLI